MPPEAWMQKLARRFIVLDGPDGSGKSTQYRRLAEALQQAGIKVELVRDPGGTLAGDAIRSMLLDPAHAHMDMRCEMLLYMASRAQLVAECIRPALEAGKCVLADRFVSSTLAYQGTAGGLKREAILQAAEIAVGDCRPDLTIIFDVDEQTSRKRLGSKLDRIESRDLSYHRRVREGYLLQARENPDATLVIDASLEPDAVYEQLCLKLGKWLKT